MVLEYKLSLDGGIRGVCVCLCILNLMKESSRLDLRSYNRVSQTPQFTEPLVSKYR